MSVIDHLKKFLLYYQCTFLVLFKILKALMFNCTIRLKILTLMYS